MRYQENARYYRNMIPKIATEMHDNNVQSRICVPLRKACEMEEV